MMETVIGFASCPHVHSFKTLIFCTGGVKQQSQNVIGLYIRQTGCFLRVRGGSKYLIGTIHIANEFSFKENLTNYSNPISWTIYVYY